MADSEYSDTEYDSPASSQAVVKVDFSLTSWCTRTDSQQDALLAPFRVLFSKTALRIYLNIILFSGATLLLLGISGIAYTIFYMNFIPTVGVDRVVHLQHDPKQHPWGTASFESEFVSSQPYDVAVVLDMPRTPKNLDVGNFMVDLTLYAHQIGGSVIPVETRNPISQSRRPAILTYSSPLVDLARRVLRLPLYLVGWRREAEILEVPMMEKVEFARGTKNLPQNLRLEIQSWSEVQIYSARVEFRARFTGLRWCMYRWKLTSFVVFSSLFWTISMGSAGLTWFVLSLVLQPAPIEEQIKEEETERVKDEPEDDDSSSEHVKVKEEEPERMLQSYPRAGDEAAQGSGLESAEARGMQKRRSRLLEDDH
ncbi:hypothetical protein N7448_006892 [Penicillium atrosanguineum]|uniref:Seipin n=1 Tax=Penicillium atrosanguineum TaxID=1132637 RepID=A0A9W9GZ66_9EURO|nr:uncharacterized protein N7443_010653 [Penicillium atrosanguineum]KAJ5132734.1 hypothetical protein N7448_006892 [Penicillium atrosanguineum]KAJ5290400.1 hypothetical protein N7443_010653 [Penicillium atrosanguineum]KAJ5308223.1 hypothetical protein N7476_008879 [Penicillium atrosanguineum]